MKFYYFNSQIADDLFNDHKDTLYSDHLLEPLTMNISRITDHINGTELRTLLNNLQPLDIVVIDNLCHLSLRTNVIVKFLKYFKDKNITLEHNISSYDILDQLSWHLKASSEHLNRLNLQFLAYA